MSGTQDNSEEFLVSMGFRKEAVQKALQKCNNNVNAAWEQLSKEKDECSELLFM